MDLGPIIFQSVWMYALTIVIAMAAAVLISVIVMILARQRASNPSAAAPAAVGESTPAAATAMTGQDAAQDHVAAISAAVYAALGVHRIVRIEPAFRSPMWATEGRWLHHASHHSSQRVRN